MLVVVCPFVPLFPTTIHITLPFAFANGSGFMEIQQSHQDCEDHNSEQAGRASKSSSSGHSQPVHNLNQKEADVKMDNALKKVGMTRQDAEDAKRQRKYSVEAALKSKEQEEMTRRVVREELGNVVSLALHSETARQIQEIREVVTGVLNHELKEVVAVLQDVRLMVKDLGRRRTQTEIQQEMDAMAAENEEEEVLPAAIDITGDQDDEA